MKLILTHEVSNLGAPGDVVEVKDGYGRNYLLPRGFAILWSKGAEKQIETIRKARKALNVRLSSRAGNSGRLFGAVTVADIATAVSKAGGPAVDKRKIEIPAPIKTVGSHKVSIRLHPEVAATIGLTIVAA